MPAQWIAHVAPYQNLAGTRRELGDGALQISPVDGMIPGSGGTQRAMRLIGATRAKLFIMTGRRIPARLAEEWGLVTQCVPEAEFEGAVESLCAELAALAPLALRTLKTVLNKGIDAPLETALELERKSYAWLRTTEDYSEGINAFFDKRKPDFKGR